MSEEHAALFELLEEQGDFFGPLRNEAEALLILLGYVEVDRRLRVREVHAGEFFSGR